MSKYIDKKASLWYMSIVRCKYFEPELGYRERKEETMSENEKNNEQGNSGEHRRDDEHRQHDGDEHDRDHEKHEPPERRVKPPRTFGS